MSESLTVNAQQTREDIQKSLQDIPDRLEKELRQQVVQCVEAFSNKLQELQLVIDTKPIQTSIDGYSKAVDKQTQNVKDLSNSIGENIRQFEKAMQNPVPTFRDPKESHS